jgi:hypothetical protein
MLVPLPRTWIYWIGAILFVFPSALAAQDASQPDAIEEPPSEAATEGSKLFNLSLSAGVELDTRVAIEEIDGAPAAKSDLAWKLGASGQYRRKLTDGTSLTLAYGFNQSLYDEYSDFDLQTHTGTVQLFYGDGPQAFLASYQFVHASIGREDFLDMQIANASYIRNIWGNWQLRANASFTKRNYLTADPFDSSQIQFSGRATWTFAGKGNTLAFYSRFEAEDARSDTLDYHSWQVGTQLAFGIDRLRDGATGRINAVYMERNYSSISPSIAAKRHEERKILSASFDLPIGDALGLNAQARHLDRSSNFATANYNEQLVSVGARYAF